MVVVALPSGSEAVPVGAEEFAHRMAAFGPFEAPPRLAAAVSGGADSLALALLTRGWAADRGGELIALTVDHGLRAGSADEAAAVGRILARHGIAHEILQWEGSKPSGNIQARARAARYALLEDWCARAGVLHLLLGHNLEDQAETVLLRLARGSGLFGLAGMAPLVERAAARLLRPFLGVPRARLRATLAAAGETWIDDPSNEAEAFARTRIRRLLPALAAENLTAERLARTATRLGGARRVVEGALAELLARAVALRPEGYALLDRDRLEEAPPDLRLRALAGIVACIGGREYPPRYERLTRLAADLGSGRTLGGCRIVPRGTRLLVCREPAAALDRRPLDPGGSVLWDGRFRLTLDGGAAGPAVVRRLGAAGWRELAAARPELRATQVPPPVRPALPALWNEDALLAVPHLRFGSPSVRVAWSPLRPLPGAPFALV